MKKVIIGVCLAMSLPLMAQANMDSAVEDIQARVQPVGQVNTTTVSEAGAAVGTAKTADGKAVYGKFCGVCHAAGVAGAPKKGDKAAWGPRVKQGMETLLKHAKNGLNAMPPKGTCASCSDAELQAAIVFMAPEGSFKD